jgi:adenine-specific DNA-methyltransferase
MTSKSKITNKSLNNLMDKSLNKDNEYDKINNTLGQYFTTNKGLKDVVYNLIRNNPKIILEPSIGQGDLVQCVLSKKSDIKFDMYEIDESIKILDGIDRNKINYGDFLKFDICKKYDTIIGNPPYIRTKKGNLYIDFIEKCYNLLEDNGELIFIVPSDVFKLTSSVKLMDIMMNNGTFTDIFHPNNEKLFNNATIDIIIFRYCKNKDLGPTTMYNDKLKYINNSNGLITFHDKEFKDINNMCVNNYFNLYVGIVSGKEEVFKNVELGNIKVLNGEDKLESYILINKFPTNNSKMDEYFIKNKGVLLNRKIRNFNENNWYEWGALRNINVMTKNMGEECIYIYNMTRKNKVAFIGKVGYFGGNLIMLKPKVSNLNLNKILEYLNGDEFKQNFMYSGRFKIGHRQLSNSYFNFSDIFNK